MELYEGLITRRSVRKYTGEKISGDAVNRIVAAGMNAPSARNTQPWHFIVIDDRGMFEKIMAFHPYSSMLSQASHAVAVCFDENLQHGPGYGVMDCSAAAENILLAAHAMGLGAVWLGIHPKPDRVEALGALLGTPPHIRPLALIALGMPAEKSEPARMRYEEGKIRYNHW